jgi:hypothetical protein
MRTHTRVAFLVLVCLGLSSLAALGQRQGQILERPVPQAQSAAEGNSEQQAMQAPLLGFVYGAERSELRPILGIPGASLFGGPISIPAGVTGVYFAPHQNYALLAHRFVGSIGLMTFQGAGGSAVAVCGAISQPDLITFSPSGSAAVLYSRGAGQIQVITGLPSAPRVARGIATGELPDGLRLLAIADDGVTLLEGTSRNAIYLLPAAGSPQLLYSATDLGGMVFAPRTTDVVVFDRGAGTLFLLQEVGSASSYLPLAEGLAGVGNAFLEISGSSAVLAGANTSSVWQIDLASLDVQSTRLPVTPRMLQPLQTSGKFLLFYKPGQPAWILDASDESGTVSFVPASNEPRLNPRHVPLSSMGGELLDTSRQPDLANRIVIGSACSESSEKSGAVRPLARPMN